MVSPGLVGATAPLQSAIIEMVSQQQEHKSVMPNEVLEMFRNFQGEPVSYFDGTFGRGGHVALVFEEYANIQVTAVDQDQVAIESAEGTFAEQIKTGQLKLHHSSYEAALKEVAGPYDLMLFDLGVSSPQLDEAERGFSFYHDGPLDMRMDQSLEQTAADLINTASEEELQNIFKLYGEVRLPNRVVRAIVHDRQSKAFTRTSQLAGLIERVDGWRKKGKHPATKYFLGLRLVVNQELEQLKASLSRMIELLSPGGVLVVLTFHSLEDRIVKVAFKEAAGTKAEPGSGHRLNKKVICATREEQQENVRSRSAKLRAFQKK